jgi:hypothetical protein
VQLIEHVVLMVALGVAVNALVVVVVVVDAAGTKQVAWHDAACELQVIMQLVVFDVCANAAPANPSTANAPSATTAITPATTRMTAFPVQRWLEPS